MNIATKRRMNDLKGLKKSPLHNIYVHCDDDNIFKSKEMLIGDSDTPYAYGYLLFSSTYPTDYPNNPPKVGYHTQGGNIRFNPNLYRYSESGGNDGGKVCLSIWRSYQ